MAAARLLRGTGRYLTLGCLILSALLGLASFNAYITFSRGSEYLMTRSDFVHSLESLWRPLSTARLQRCTGDQREHLKKKHSLCPDKELMNSSEVTKLGRYPTTKRFLTIGIASVERPNGANYLLQTTQSLINHTSDLEKKDMYVVILLADLQDTTKFTRRRELFVTFDKYIEQGFLTVIEAYSAYYPDLNNISEKYGDSVQRRAWRSKQNVDNSFLMCYCKDFSHYYIHLEDDVKSSPSFVSKLRDFITTQTNTDWPRLNVAVKGGVAKVYHSQDLENMASYFYLMYDEMPIDWLMVRWINFKYHARYEKEPFLASLFQHVGVQSSLAEKGINRNSEPFFDQYDHKYKGLNPPATVTSSLASYQGDPQDAYDKGSGYFWSKNPQKNDYVLIKFNAETGVQKVFVDTGSYRARKDLLYFGVLQASFRSAENETQTTGHDSCGQFVTIGSFDKGQVKTSLDESRKVTCLKILVTKHQEKQIFLREIDVWQSLSKPLLPQ